MLINRRQTKLIKLGPYSLVTVIPWEIIKAWNLKKGDAIVTYQIDNLLVLTPLAHLGMTGEPRLVRHLELLT